MKAARLASGMIKSLVIRLNHHSRSAHRINERIDKVTGQLLISSPKQLDESKRKGTTTQPDGSER